MEFKTDRLGIFRKTEDGKYQSLSFLKESKEWEDNPNVEWIMKGNFGDEREISEEEAVKLVMREYNVDEKDAERIVRG